MAPGGSKNINISPCYGGAMDPAMALGHNISLDITMVSGGSTGYSHAGSHRPLDLQFCISSEFENYSASLSLPSLHHILAHCSGASRAGLWVSSAHFSPLGGRSISDFF